MRRAAARQTKIKTSIPKKTARIATQNLRQASKRLASFQEPDGLPNLMLSEQYQTRVRYLKRKTTEKSSKGLQCKRN